MKKTLYLFLLTSLCSLMGVNTATAKEKTPDETVVFALSPEPTCQNCVNKIKGNLRFEKGIKAIEVDLTKKNVTLTYSPKSTTAENLVKALKKIGYTATPYLAEDSDEQKDTK